MLLEHTLRQLDIGHVPPEQAAEMGALGYLQWLAGLPGHTPYKSEAMRAYALAHPLARTSPAVSVFCGLLVSSTETPLKPICLVAAGPRRRGGAPARRRQRMR
ncbi:MAG: hypothetical protein AAFV62_05120 [Pseudomonadota bacterium]